MDLRHFFFYSGPALEYIFKMGYIPRETDFQELTEELYAAFRSKASAEDLKKMGEGPIYAFVPDDPQAQSYLTKTFGNNLAIMTSAERSGFSTAVSYIDKECNESGKTFKSDSDKLKYMADRLPAFFSEDTPYAAYAPK